MNRDEIREYVAVLSEVDARAQLVAALHKLQLVRLGPKNAPVGAVLELADFAVEQEAL